ncbi:MAG TPA: phosphoribosylanthranilate isomerase [Edaphobacter sp.]|nr:phosphoribosylanthranilate isomerase [Edaphobacter sp.]
MWIKICANTNLDDAQLAVELGADALGFVFASSKRQVTAAEVARITPHLPHGIERVGVFDTQNADAIAGIALEAGLTAVQLHGGVNHALAAELAEFNERFEGRLSLIQTLHWHVDADEDSIATVGRQLADLAAAGVVERVLIDSRVGQAGGGTGRTFNWERAKAVLAEGAGHLKLIVAGGLRPQNVAEAIRGLNPWGVDVVSGVEAHPGRKDPEKLAAFIANARQPRAV